MGDNADLIRRWFDEVWNQGRADAIDELLAPDATIHGLAPGDMTGPQAFRAFHSALHVNFSKIHVRVEKTVEDGDDVSAWCRVTATHRDSGKAVAFTGAVLMVVGSGRFQEGWNNWDFLGLLTQLGAVDAETVGPLLGA